MQAMMITLLDALGLVVLATGLGLCVRAGVLLWWGANPPQGLAGGLGVLVAGGVLSLGSWLAYRRSAVDQS